MSKFGPERPFYHKNRYLPRVSAAFACKYIQMSSNPVLWPGGHAVCDGKRINQQHERLRRAGLICNAKNMQGKLPILSGLFPSPAPN
ncbi:hypothetical protein CSC3H3_16555 [Thalassospira marina]|uniref:Uncharacterized protein n=1 Tax=Thalassospira marina TaxID=2048283 RepID=A0ABM6QD05_9PROT|nr:hypothetical protein CSC3H3_16555 [Thalassospira marina]